MPAQWLPNDRDRRLIERRSLWWIFAYLALVTVAGPTYLARLIAALDEYVPSES